MCDNLYFYASVDATAHGPNVTSNDVTRNVIPFLSKSVLKIVVYTGPVAITEFAEIAGANDL